MSLRHWFLLSLVQAAWAGSYVAMKVAGQEIPVFGVVFWRYGIASVCFLAFWLVKGFPRFSKRDFLFLSALGILNFTLAPALQVMSLKLTQAADVAMVVALEPMLTVALASLAIREQAGRRTWVALGVGTFGMVVLSGVLCLGGVSPSTARLAGNLVFLAALLCEVAVNIGGRVFTKRYPPSAAIGAMMVSGFLGCAILAPRTVVSLDHAAISTAGWMSLLFLGFGCSVFAYVVWYHVIRDVPVGRVALSLFLQPVIGSLLGIWLLGESLGVDSLVGAALILGSLAWWQTKRG